MIATGEFDDWHRRVFYEINLLEPASILRLCQLIVQHIQPVSHIGCTTRLVCSTTPVVHSTGSIPLI